MDVPTLDRFNAALNDRYRIEREIGSGGMATVYLAHDERHDRKVALKILRPELAAVMGADRFLSEIRTTANLQHPHILQLYDSGDAGGFLYFVMPYVEGESLRSRIDREKQLPVDDAVGIARAIAGALQAAHEQGVVHRDIKPANILLSHEQPVVADFGIALAIEEAGGGRLTETGLSLGTPYYMSPEQASADRDPDARSDIYSLGSVLYEMLTGEPPFTGSTAQAVLGKILTAQPARPTTHRKAIPPHVEAVILRSLERLPADRFGSAAEFAAALANPDFRYGKADAASARTADALEVAALRRRANVSTLAAAALGVALLASLVLDGRTSLPLGAAVEFYVDPDSTHTLVTAIPGALALSPDGTTLGYVGRLLSGETEIFVRRLDERDAHAVAGTEDAHDVFFSPDGAWIGFSTNALQMKKVRLAGGSPATITSLAGPLSNAHWIEGDRIIYGVSGAEGIMRVSADGGEPEEVLAQDDTITGMIDPWVLPGGRTALFTGLMNGNHLMSVDLETGEAHYLAPGITPRYVDSGFLIYGTEDQALLAHAFDADRLELVGQPSRIAESVSGWLGISRDLAVSASGPIAYLRGSGANEILLLPDAGPTRRLRSADVLASPRSTPDGDQVLYVQQAVTGSGVYVYSLSQETTRLIVSGQNVLGAEWAPDLRSVVYYQGPLQETDIWVAPTDGSDAPFALLERERAQMRPAFTWDGSHVVFSDGLPAERNIYAIAADGTGEVIPVATGEAYEDQPTPSPAGPWIAYSSEATGISEVYVKRFPGDGSEVPISNGGGGSPAWSLSGDTLYYHDGSSLVAAELTFTPEPSVVGRTVVRPWPYAEDGRSQRSYDVHPDGFVVAGSQGSGARIVVRTGLPVGGDR